MNTYYPKSHQSLEWWFETKQKRRSLKLSEQQALAAFLQSIERSAYRIAWFATNNPDDAVELVQESMTKLVEKYSTKPPNELKSLFYRILHNQIADRYRRANTTSRWLFFASTYNIEEQPSANEKQHKNWQPDHQSQSNEATEQLMKSLSQLPMRQREVFLLRAWEGLSVSEAAFALGITEGSIKTHYSRAVHSLREQLKDYYEPV